MSDIHDKLFNLAEAKQAKINTLSGTQLQDRRTELEGNEVHTDEYGQYQVVDDRKVPYAGYTKNLYQDETPQGNQKLGLASTQHGGFANRYSDNDKFDGTPGPMGVTVDNGADYERVMPYNEVTRFENDVYQNKGMIEARVAGLGYVGEETKKAIGPGWTEYTTPDAPLYNPSTQISNDPLPEGTYVPKTAYTGVPEGYEKVKSGV